MSAKKVLAVVIVLALAGGGVLLVRSKKAQVAAAPTPTERPAAVRTVIARRGPLQEVRTYLARVEPWQVAEVSAQVTARVERVTVREGDPVRKGDLLVVLDDTEVRSSLAEAEAQIAQAKAQVAGQEATVSSLEQSVRYWERELRRDDVLAREGAIAQAVADATADRFSEARGRLDASREAVKAARMQVEALTQRREAVAVKRAYTRIESPFDGVVARRYTDPGDLAAPGKPLIVVEDRSRVKLLFDVPQEDLARVKTGTPVHVNEDLDLDLRISRMYPSLNPDRTLTVEAHAPASAGVPTGTYHPVDVVLRSVDDAVLVPEECLVPSPDGGRAVFVVVDGRAQALPVEVLLVRQGLGAVRGIEAGLQVVQSTYLGWNRLASGQPVEVLW